METKSLVPKNTIEEDKMRTLKKDVGDFKSYVRTSKGGDEFLINGENIGSNEIV